MLPVRRYFVRRVVILGRAAAGKTTLSLHLGEIEELPAVELDKLFWRFGSTATPRAEWIALQQELIKPESWILDGDLGGYDAVGTRLSAADTIILLDFSFMRCAWRAWKRSREGIGFGRWMASYRWRNLPHTIEAIEKYASNAEVHVFRGPRALAQFVELRRNSLTCDSLDEAVFASKPLGR
jgi:hypothetical protein